MTITSGTYHGQGAVLTKHSNVSTCLVLTTTPLLPFYSWWNEAQRYWVTCPGSHSFCLLLSWRQNIIGPKRWRTWPGISAGRITWVVSCKVALSEVLMLLVFQDTVQTLRRYMGHSRPSRHTPASFQLHLWPQALSNPGCSLEGAEDALPGCLHTRLPFLGCCLLLWHVITIPLHLIFWDQHGWPQSPQHLPGSFCQISDVTCLHVGLTNGPWALGLGRCLTSSRSSTKFAAVDWIDVGLEPFRKKRISRIHLRVLCSTGLGTRYLLSATGDGREEIQLRILVWVSDHLKLLCCQLRTV